MSMSVEHDPLGPQYQSRTLPLRDGEVATLVRLPASDPVNGAVLYVHGYIDYFFQTHVAEHFTERGYDFYAVDLRRCGRSLRPGDLKFYFDDLATFEEELDLSVEAIRADGHAKLTVLGSSTGGLAACLWLNRRGDAIPVEALVLNSPWLDLQEPWPMRTLGTMVLYGLSQVTPRTVLPQGISAAYGPSIHADHHGDFAFDTTWKPLVGAPTYVGVIAAVRRGHAKVHRGLNLRMPILVMHSDSSLLGLQNWTPKAQYADCVLDVKQMTQWAPKLGLNVTDVTINGGVHDLFLSSAPVRADAFAKMDAWLEQTRVTSATG